MRLGLTPAIRLQAYDAAVAQVRPPVVAPPGAIPSFGDRVDFVTRIAFTQLFLEILPGGYYPPGAPKPVVRPPSAGVQTAAAPDLEKVLTNLDGLRRYASRRVAVDVLKKFQSEIGYTTLGQARAVIAAQLPTLAGLPAVEAMDLLGRIDRALAAYFD